MNPNTLMGQALADRPDACNLPRIPTGRYPAYSTTRCATFDANGVAEIEVEAERDLLFTDMTIDAGSPLTERLTITYCNVSIVLNGDTRVWQRCCGSRPFFLVGVRENKSLFIRITGGTPDDQTCVTLYGFQGNGCCG